MADAQPPVRLPRKPKGERPRYFDDPAIDKLIGMVMALTGEVAVLRDRQDTVERLIEARGGLDRAEIEAWRPSPEVIAERDAWREMFLGEVLRIVRQDLEGIEREAGEPYQAAVDLVNQH